MVKPQQLHVFNSELKTLSSLEMLRLGIYLSTPSRTCNEYPVTISAPPSLLSLCLHPIEEYAGDSYQLHFSFVGTAEHPTGIPPMLKVLALDTSCLGSYFTFSSDQADQLPTSLEYFCCEHRLTDEQRARLHNLV